jgi:hypothetical protein
VAQPEAALLPGAPQLHDDVPGNLAFEAEAGNAQAVEAAAGVVLLGMFPQPDPACPAAAGASSPIGGGTAALLLDMDRVTNDYRQPRAHVGDSILREISDRLRTCARPGDTAVRVVATGSPSCRPAHRRDAPRRWSRVGRPDPGYPAAPVPFRIDDNLIAIQRQRERSNAT